jgi:hypothetical protein
MILSWSMAAGRCTSAATRSGLIPRFLFKNLASFPQVVVLPEPCRPAIIITVGRFWFTLIFVSVSPMR